VSGAGLAGWQDLENGLKGIAPTNFSRTIAGNLIPQVDVFKENGYTGEEMKMINETIKILHAPDMKVTATCVRVPVFNGHSESINVEFENIFEMEDIIKTLENAPGVIVQNNMAAGEYPTPIDADGSDDVYIGRIRRDTSSNGINMWVVADNIRKGAATNAIQIAELPLK
jgi:aspartate-semialdehyde dehydrogenase